jgi:hypothetical protein
MDWMTFIAGMAAGCAFTTFGTWLGYWLVRRMTIERAAADAAREHASRKLSMFRTFPGSNPN